MDPKISIVIPFFNAEKTLSRAVESIVNQDEVDWELILVNDGSQDGSQKVAQTYLGDHRVKLLIQENKGVSPARNFGASKAEGDWLIFLDADDYFELNSLHIISNQIVRKVGQSYLIFGLNRIKKDSKIVQIPKEGKYFSKLAGTFVIRKSVFMKISGYDVRLKFSENTELFHRVQLEGYVGKSIPEVILNYIDNLSGGSKNLQNMIDSLSLILEKHDQTLSSHVKHLYHQIIGVNWIRFRNFSEARKHLWKAVKYQPKKLATWGRLGLAFFPFLAKRFYSETVNHA